LSDVLGIKFAVCDGRVKGLKHRREKDEAVSAYFSHIGELYQVHHLWCEYADVVSVQELRCCHTLGHFFKTSRFNLIHQIAWENLLLVAGVISCIIKLRKIYIIMN